MNKLLYLLTFVLFISSHINAQNDSIKYEVGITGVTSTGSDSPFWLQSRSYGAIASAPHSANLMLGISKNLGNSTRLFDYGFKADFLFQTYDNKTNTYFHELYVKARFLVFDLIVGSREEILGNQDSTLSGGGLLFSQNSQPMPKITIGMEHFTAVPFTQGFVEIKGALSHGYFSEKAYEKGAFLHHKYANIKLGGKLPVHLQYGLDHAAVWGGNIPGLGEQPVGLRDYKTIFLGHSGGTDALAGEQINALGNHIISQSMKLEADISEFKLSAYWQNISEDGPVKKIWDTMNLPDGLWGFSIHSSKYSFIKAVLYEYLNTTDQSGPYHDKDGIIYGGADSYFENYVYHSGWTYNSRIIGTPFISGPTFNSNGELTSLNNRVQVHHFGIEGDISSYQYRMLSSISKNYGSYRSPTAMKRNTSLLLEVNKQFPKLFNIELSCSVAGDFGALYGNSAGCQFSIRKTGNLFHY